MKEYLLCVRLSVCVCVCWNCLLIFKPDLNYIASACVCRCVKKNYKKKQQKVKAKKGFLCDILITFGVYLFYCGKVEGFGDY